MESLEPMTIALIVLVIAGIWAVVELALTFRQTRKSVSELTDSVNDTIADIRPVVAKLDGVADELPAAAKQIEPILEKASTTVDLINVDLVRVEGILSDVNAVTDTGARASGAVTGAVESVASGVAGVVNKVAGKVSGKGSAQAKIAAGESPAALEGTTEPVASEQVSGDAGYFTYPSEGEAAQAAAPVAEPESAVSEPEAAEPTSFEVPVSGVSADKQ